MKELVFATNNQNKLREIRDLAAGRIHILSLDEVRVTGEIPEHADTLEGNASIKSWHIHSLTGKDCFADDTGLEIKALRGRPGVKSARYAGEECIASNNIRKVLQEMEGIGERQARFRTVISLIENGEERIFEGIVEGHILFAPRGVEGFGYDPIFVPDGYNISFAEMPLEEKNRISHRAKAFQALISFLVHAGPSP